MGEPIFQFLLKHFYFFIDAFIAVKIILFIRDKSKSWKFAQFFYFHRLNMENTEEKGKTETTSKFSKDCNISNADHTAECNGCVVAPLMTGFKLVNCS
jgi:hypothetical protein